MWKKKTTNQNIYFNAEKVFLASSQALKSANSYFQTTSWGLTREDVYIRQKLYGKNEVIREQRPKKAAQLYKAFINPFIGILTVLILITLLINVLISNPEERDWTSVGIISIMVVLSALLRFWQEWRAGKAMDSLRNMVKNRAFVKRDNLDFEVEIDELVPGDIVYLSAGDMIPADIRIIEAKDLFISQSALTGESDAVEKFPVTMGKKYRTGSVVELDNICYMGSTVVSGIGKGIVFQTGNDTYLGTIAKSIMGVRVKTAFDKGIGKVSMLLVRFMLIMVPFVFMINGLVKGTWLEAFIFALSVAVGLTPEMLPMIVTATLAKGAVTMSKKKVIVKNLSSIQDFGAMNILCTDKTGTLTRDNIVLEKYITADGNEDTHKRILNHAYFNSYFQTGLKSLMDKAILSHTEELHLESIANNYTKVDEIPFDFMRRRVSVIVENNKGKRQIITKGAVEEMLSICSHVESDGRICPMDDKLYKKTQDISNRMNREGMRVLAVAHKSWVEKPSNFTVEDETDMVLIGFLAFLDPPKSSAAEAIRQMQQYNVEVKILSGDNESIVKNISRQVGIDTGKTLNGYEIEKMTDEELRERVCEVNLFSKLTPIQKTRIICLLQEVGNTVGFLGDGVNDAAALRQSDVGISVDTAVDIAKESADIILLEKDLMVLGNGVIEGRKTFGNIIKYIKITASSNFGNVLSVLAASTFLPFLPMLPIHLLIQNLLYDVSQITIPFDNIDKEDLQKPRHWDTSDLGRFMIFVGPISSIFDIVTYLMMWYIFGCKIPETQALFHSGWFVEGLLSQVLIMHIIRTRKMPLLQSRASGPVIWLTLIIMACGVILPFTSFGESIGLVPLPLSYFPLLITILLIYCILTQLGKRVYIKHFSHWL